jgi:hypothetical protein
VEKLCGSGMINQPANPVSPFTRAMRQEHEPL